MVSGLAALAALTCAAAQEPDQGAKLQLRLECLDDECATVAIATDVMRAIQRNNAAFAQANRELTVELARLRASKSCAGGEAAQPASKPLPPIPREADS